MTEREREFADAARVVDESATMRAITAVLCRATFSRSRSATPSAALKGPLYTTVIVGILTHALLLQLIPDRIAPVKPLAYGVVLAFAALCVVAGFITTRSKATAIAESSAGTANTRNN